MVVTLKNFKTNAGLPLALARQSCCTSLITLTSEITVYSDFRCNGDKLFSPVYLLDNTLWVLNLVENYFPGVFTLVNFSNEGVIFYLSPKDLKFVAKFFKYSWFFRAQELIDVFAVDFPSRANRFELTYVLLSTRNNERIYLRCYTKEFMPVSSLSSLFNSANWLEREIWDMHGVTFGGNSDLRRILTDYGFFGHPLRKDFPVTGFYELRYDDTARQVVSESVNLLQELRLFFFGTPWVVFKNSL